MCHIDCLRVHCRRMTGGLTPAGADSLEKLVDYVSGIPANNYDSTSLELTKTVVFVSCHCMSTMLSVFYFRKKKPLIFDIVHIYNFIRPELIYIRQLAFIILINYTYTNSK